MYKKTLLIYSLSLIIINNPISAKIIGDYKQRINLRIHCYSKVKNCPAILFTTTDMFDKRHIVQNGVVSNTYNHGPKNYRIRFKYFHKNGSYVSDIKRHKDSFTGDCVKFANRTHRTEEANGTEDIYAMTSTRLYRDEKNRRVLEHRLSNCRRFFTKN